MLNDFRSLFRNWLTIAGGIVTSFAALIFLFVFLLDLFGYHTNPYIGIVFFLILPGIFLFGLLLIPAGLWLERRRLNKGLPPSRPHWPDINLNNPHTRRVVLAVVALTVVNVLIVSLAAYRGIEEMDSVRFCGQVCHTVMQPEFTAYQNGPHSRVECVQCHIGPGAPWFVRSKLDGVRQVIGVTFDTYDRPIPSPVHTLRPAREVCEQCHWPERFTGDKVDVIREYANDEKNTETVTNVQLHVGGGRVPAGQPNGIHWHVNPDNQIEYVAVDDKRQEIGYVKLTDRNGKVTEFYADGVSRDRIAKGERRRMDCMDCHNRPSHRFAPSADRAVDEAMGSGDIPRTLPFARREAVAAVKDTYPDRQVASDRIAERLRGFYRSSYPALYNSRRADVERVVAGAQAVYAKNIFPSMKVGWGTYPNNVGHVAFPGCFRCHDDSHKAASGAVIKQDCEMCHAIS